MTITTEETLSHLRDLYRKNPRSRTVIAHVAKRLKEYEKNPPKRWRLYKDVKDSLL